MLARLICEPPMGQATVVTLESKEAIFNVVLESNAPASQEWHVELWHNHGSAWDWSGTAFEELRDSSNVLVVAPPPEAGLTRRFFRAVLSGKPKDKDLVSFTLRYRRSSSEPWMWVRDQTSLPDGHLCYQKVRAQDTALDKYFKDLNPDLKVVDEIPQNAARVWSVSGKVDAANGKDSAWTKWRLGMPAGFSRFFALIRMSSPWLAPRHGQNKFFVEKDAILVSFLMHDGTHVVLVAISGIGDELTFFKHDGDGSVVLHARSDSDKPGLAYISIAAGATFEEANASAIFQARRMVMRSSTQEKDIVVQELDKTDIKPQWLEEWYDGFSYCTWNGLGRDLNEQKIFDALKSLRDNDINITNLIIDDNWQSLDNPGEGHSAPRWLEFEANKEGFPNGLAHTTSELRQQNPNLKHIAVWHAILGYWGAISPDGKLAKNYKTMQVKNDGGPAGELWTVIHPDDIPRFYNDFYQFLNGSGVDSVKTDAQCSLDAVNDAPDRRAMTKVYQDYWSIALLRYFSGRAISCMSQVPQIMFHSQLPSNKPRMLVRNSDDFFPDVEDSHPWHVFCNAYKALFTQHLNALPDWDMFQTSHPWAAFHAAARCVSGGPIYCTDTPGKHDVDLIRQMTAQTIRGDTVILRPSVIGKSSQPYVGYDEQRLLKIATYHGHARTGASILGIFNTCQKPMAEIVSLADFPGTEEGTYVIRSHVSGRCTLPIAIGKPGYNFILMDLAVKGYDILTAHAIHGPLTKRDDGNDFLVANLGLMGKMSGAAAVVGTSISSDQNWSARLWTSLKALGTLGVYITDLEKRDMEKDFMVLMFGRPIEFYCVKKNEEENVLLIDVTRAWKDARQDPGWSNEVSIELFIR